MRKSELNQPQFGLKSLLIAMAVVCTHCAVGVWEPVVLFWIMPFTIFTITLVFAKRSFRGNRVGHIASVFLAILTGTVVPALYFGIYAYFDSHAPTANGPVWKATGISAFRLYTIFSAAITLFICTILAILYGLISIAVLTSGRVEPPTKTHGRNSYSN